LNKDDNVTPVGIFLIIVMILVQVGSIKKTPCMTCPVMDIIHQERGSTRAIRPDISMRDTNLTKPVIKLTRNVLSLPRS